MIDCIFVPDVSRVACNQAAYERGIDPEGTMTTFSVPLVPSAGEDEAEPTYWAARGAISAIGQLWVDESDASIPGVMWWRWDISPASCLHPTMASTLEKRGDSVSALSKRA